MQNLIPRRAARGIFDDLRDAFAFRVGGSRRIAVDVEHQFVFPVFADGGIVLDKTARTIGIEIIRKVGRKVDLLRGGKDTRTCGKPHDECRADQ